MRHGCGDGPAAACKPRRTATLARDEARDGVRGETRRKLQAARATGARGVSGSGRWEGENRVPGQMKVTTTPQHQRPIPGGDAGRVVSGCSRSGRPLEAPQRFCPDDGTMDSTVTRGYPQTPVAQRQWDLLMRRQRKVQVVTGTQTGRRMLDMMRSVAVPGGRLDRRGEG